MALGRFSRSRRAAAPPAVVFAAAGAAFAATPLPPLPPLLSADEQSLYNRAFESLDAGRADEARRLASQGSNNLAAKTFPWADLLTPPSGPPSDDIAPFIAANPP